MSDLKMVLYDEKYKTQIIEYFKEYQDMENSDKMIKQKVLCDNKTENQVPSTLFLLIRQSNNKILGISHINHYLNEELFKCGGHLNISIRPTERKIEYYIKQLKLSLELCKELKIGRVIIDCSKKDIFLSKAIEENGGVLDKEDLENKRYLISLKKRYGNRHKLKKSDIEIIYVIENFQDDNFKGDVTYYDFKNSDIKITTPKGKTIIDNNYKLLEFYDYNSKVKLSAFYDNNNNITEWYFDIAKEIGKENGIPYEDDLYLDVVVKIDGTVILLDEDELEDALKKYEITNQEYKMAYAEANKLMLALKNKKEELNCFTQKYLDYFLKKGL